MTSNSKHHRYDRRYREVRRAVLAQATRCTWCGCEISDLFAPNHPQKATADHLIPRSHGGPHSIENLVPACFSCNVKRRDSGADWRPGADLPGTQDW